LRRAAEEDGETGSEISARHGEGTEDQRYAHIQVARLPVPSRSNQAGRAGHGQAHCDRLLRAEVQQVDEYWDSEDRPTAAQHAEGEADHECEGEAENQHIDHRTTSCTSSDRWMNGPPSFCM